MINTRSRLLPEAYDKCKWMVDSSQILAIGKIAILAQFSNIFLINNIILIHKRMKLLLLRFI